MTRRLAVRDWRAKSVQDRRVYTRLTLVIVIADLDTLLTALTALYVELTDRIIPLLGFAVRAGQAAGGDRRRAGLPGRGAGAAAL
jgi:hypothetical protein